MYFSELLKTSGNNDCFGSVFELQREHFWQNRSCYETRRTWPYLFQVYVARKGKSRYNHSYPLDSGKVVFNKFRNMVSMILWHENLEGQLSQEYCDN